MNSIKREDGIVLTVGDEIEFLGAGGMFKKGERAKVLEFSDDGRFFYYNGTLAISTNDKRIKKINNDNKKEL